MSDESAPRALEPLRLLIFAAVLTLGSILLGTQSARADGSTPEQRVLSGPASSISIKPPHVRIEAPIRVAVADPNKTTARTARAKTGAVAKPVAAVFKPVTSVGDHGSSQLPAVKRIIAPEPIGPVTKIVTDVVAKGVTTASFITAVELKTAMALSSSVEVIGRRHSSGTFALADMGPTMNEPVAGLTFFTSEPQTVVGSSWYTLISASDAPSLGASGPSSPTSPGTPKKPVSMPSSTTTGAPGTSSGGYGSALADLSGVPRVYAALLQCGLPLGSSVLPKSLANDPGSSPA